MSDRKLREKVAAEITLVHRVQIAAEAGGRVSREDAVAVLNQNGRAYDLWKNMMQAGSAGAYRLEVRAKKRGPRKGGFQASHARRTITGQSPSCSGEMRLVSGLRRLSLEVHPRRKHQ